MIKKISSILLVLLFITGCSSNKNEPVKEEIAKKTYTFLAPNGAPSLALLDFVGDNNFDLDFVDGADIIQTEFSKGEKDFIIAPINLGYILSEKTQNYTLCGVVTWGNLYIIGKDDKINPNGTLAAFSEAAVPGKIINLIAEKSSINPNITWFQSVADAATAFLSGEFDYAVVAEPYLTNLEFQNGDFKVLSSLSDLYLEITGLKSFPQAALFVKKTLYDSNDPIINQVTVKIKDSINTYVNNPDKLDTKLANTDLSIMGFNNKKIILDAYSNLGLNYIDKNDCKEEITYLLKLFGIEYK